MSKLDDLEKKLYREGEDEPERRMRRRITFPRSRPAANLYWKEKAPSDAPPQKGKGIFLKIFFIFFVIALVAGGGFFVFYYLGTRGQEVQISIEGNTNITSGDEILLPITIRNTTRSVLREVELTIQLPEGSMVVEDGVATPALPRIIQMLDNLAPKEERHIELHAQLFGREGESKTVEIEAVYRPENVRARFTARTTKVFAIARVPLALFWDAPDTASQDQEVLMNVRVVSNAREEFGNLSVRVVYPPGFTFLEGTPPPDVDLTTATFKGAEGIWHIGSLEPQENKEFSFYGILSGAEGERKAFRAEAGAYDELRKSVDVYTDETREVLLALTPLSLEVVSRGTEGEVISPGERVSALVRYRNNTDYILNNVSIRAFLEGEILKQETLTIDQGGVFEFSTQAVVWGPGSVDELREVLPGQEGAFRLGLETRDPPIVQSANDKNLAVKIVAEVNPQEIPEALAGVELFASDTLEYKVRSKIRFSGRGLYRLSPLSNTGPLPPTVGQETTYTVVWEVRNFTNDVRDAEVVASLPTNVSWKGSTSPSDAHITFDSGSRQVRWVVGALDAGVGVLRPAKTVSFQVAVTPSEVDVGETMTLIRESQFAGRDVFVGEQVDGVFGAITTEVRDDSTVGSDEWRVVPNE